MPVAPEAATASLAGVSSARAATALARLSGWQRPARRVLALALFFAAWHLATTYRLDLYVRFQNVPTPAQVLDEVMDLFASVGFYVHILASLERIWLGFAIATVLGVGLGLLIGRFRFAEDTMFPIVELLRPIPAVAWVPLSIMLWPTELSSIVFITALGAFFPIVLNTIHGVEGIDRQLVRAALSLGAGPAAVFREVVIPGALPSIVTGLSVGMGVSWLCLISAEMISGQFGVGYFTWVAYGIVKHSQIVVGMLVIGVLGMLSSALIRLIGARCMPWLPRRATA
jgi:NitT/TauT family transport system permease protein